VIRHLFKLFWIRRKANGLLLTEIVISTLVLFAVVYMVMSGIQNWNKPVGFDYHDLYAINLDIWRMEEVSAESAPLVREKTVRVLRAIEEMPGVVAAGGMNPAAYSIAYSSTELRWKEKSLTTELTTATDELRGVLDIDMIQGRWFDKSDESLEWTPIVIDERVAKELFGDENPLGQIADEDGDYHVVGVCEPFRAHGELSNQKYFAFVRQRTESNHGNVNPLSTILVRVQPGSPASIEHDLLRRAQSVAPDWSLTIDSAENMRNTTLRVAIIPIALLGGVAAFLLIMVVLGLLGVFWQAVTSRIEELGLRRSFGGTRKQVLLQIQGEIFVLTLVGGLIAGVLVVQLPILGILDAGAGAKVVISLIFTLILMFVMTSLSGLYPSILASRIEPAEAMRYE